MESLLKALVSSPTPHMYPCDTKICSPSGEGGVVCCRTGDMNTEDAAHASHLMHFATTGEAISNAVPGAGAVASARACVLAEPKGTAASIVLAGKAKGCLKGLL